MADIKPTPTVTPTPAIYFNLTGSEYAPNPNTFSFVNANKIILEIDSEGRVKISPYVTLEDLAEVIQILRDKCGK